MKLYVITGLSGAGKSRAMGILEDAGFFCVDNMPPALLPKLSEICSQSQGKIDKVAMAADIRGGILFGALFNALNELKENGIPYKIIFMEAETPTLINRYKESRRRHPLLGSGDGSVEKAIEKEVELLSEVRNRADLIIDTTNTTVNQLKEYLLSAAATDTENKDTAIPMMVNVMSFGFKYGIPLGSDIVLDVRFLPNPFYEAALREKTGLDKEVIKYIFNHSVSKEFLKKTQNYLEYLLPHYVEEGKAMLEISVGCTGGRHRSVAVAEKISAFLKKNGYIVSVEHRDIIR